MNGSLVQLVTYGAHDIYLTGGGIFRVQYVKHNIKKIIIGFEFIKICDMPKNIFSFNSKMFDEYYEMINCSNAKIKKLPKYKLLESFRKLKYFNCAKNNIENISKLSHIELEWLDCSFNYKIKIIPNKMRNLKYFDFSKCGVTYTVNFEKYPKLKYLMASSNCIKDAINLQPGLIYLDLSNNPIDQLNNLPNELEYLLLVQTHINSSTLNMSNLSKLKYLDISINMFGCLDNLPKSLKYLNCSECYIDGLNNMPLGLVKLICINSNIKNLDMLPESISILNCDHNSLTQLDNLPTSITKLICSNNNISKLDCLGFNLNLKELDCSFNPIETMNGLPKNVKVTNNQK